MAAAGSEGRGGRGDRGLDLCLGVRGVVGVGLVDLLGEVGSLVLPGWVVVAVLLGREGRRGDTRECVLRRLLGMWLRGTHLMKVLMLV